MNKFGQGYVQSQAYPLLFPLYDPREVRTNRTRFRRDSIPALARANSFYCPAGRWPSRGWILMTRHDLNLLNLYSTTLRLDIGNAGAYSNVAPLNNLSIVQAQCVTRGLASDPAALYLVEITDARGILHNKWFQFPTTFSYNIRAPGYSSTARGGTFYPSSMNTGVSPTTTWTWSTMVGDLWSQMSTFLGPYPGLPITPDGTPEGFWFPGVSAWTALNDILDHLGMLIACDLQATIPYTIVLDGANDLAVAALQTLYRPSLEDDLEWIDIGAGRVPLTVKVFFKRRNEVYGTEETTPYRNDNMAQQWAMNPAYSVSVNAVTDLGLTQFAAASGTHYTYSDFTVRYDHNSTILPEDAAFAATLAKQRAIQYYGHIDPGQHLSQTYAGPLPFKTGSRIDGVRWYQDYSDDARQGWKTQIVHGPDPPWLDIWDR